MNPKDMNLLVCNVGSTSLKFKLYGMPSETLFCEAVIERVGSVNSAILHYKDSSDNAVDYYDLCIPEYKDGINEFIELLSGKAGISAISIDAVAFKTVLSKGFYGVHLLDQAVMEGMKDYLYIAPVHNAAYLEAIEQFQKILPDIPMIGVFETAFHQTIPTERRMYSIPQEWHEKYGIRKMGYHGASHSYVAQRSPRYGKADKVISCHLGGSCSICAISGGKSVDSSFGFSLQTGVMHANRCGTIDPYIIPFLLQKGLSMEEITYGLSHNGGLKGLSGISNDLRIVMEAVHSGSKQAEMAVNVFITEIIRYIGAYYVELGGLDQLVFTGGIGEHSEEIREMICAKLSSLGITIDPEKNHHVKEGVISEDNAAPVVTVIKANEELGVSRLAYRELARIGRTG